MIKYKKIILLENILVDSSLPKYIKDSEPVEPVDSNTFTLTNDSGFTLRNSVIFNNNPTSWEDSDFLLETSGAEPMTDGFASLEYLQYCNPKNIALKFAVWVVKNFGMRGKKRKLITVINLTKFFESIKQSASNFDKKSIDEILSKYSGVIQNAKDNNQIALVEKLTKYVSVLKDELTLSVSKFNKYLTEADIVKFHETASVHGKYNTGLRLTYIKNFIKIIPSDITDLKIEADKLKVFDNYVILHYDYDNSGVAETDAEIEKRKDPILFGVIKNSTNLYYIGDWVDEYCNLTLDVIIKKLGKKSVKAVTPKSINKNLMENITK